MVLEIDKACVLEAVENSVSRLLLGRGVAGEEGREVDKLLLSDTAIERSNARILG